MNHHLIPDSIRQKLLQPNSVVLGSPATGGLSGAWVWQCESQAGPACLRAWPSPHPSPQRLQAIHSGMRVARSGGADFVPELYFTATTARSQPQSFVSDGRRLWELTQWMPGRADYLRSPSLPRLQAAMQALAQLHACWAHGPKEATGLSESPTVRERAHLLSRWLSERASWEHLQGATPLENALIQDTRRYLLQLGPNLLEQLRGLAQQKVALHFVVRDIWSDHVLFSDEQVTGIIDFGAARIDEPATDVARLLGSLEPYDRGRWQLGFQAYHLLNPSVREDRVQILDQAATLLSALQWLTWLIIEPREFTVPKTQLLARWQSLLARFFV